MDSRKQLFKQHSSVTNIVIPFTTCNILIVYDVNRYHFRNHTLFSNNHVEEQNILKEVKIHI